jgi:2-methylcitrate dehydratase PrpD
VPYAVAAAWIDGGLGIRNFSDEGLNRADVQELTARIQPYVDDDLSEWSRVVTPAKLTVQFRDGQTVEARVDYPKGHPRNPMTKAEFAAKTKDCAAFAARPLPPDTSDRLISTVGELERLAEISELVDAVTAMPN